VNNNQSFQCTVPEGLDGIDPVQQIPGQKTIFAIDGPGVRNHQNPNDACGLSPPNQPLVTSITALFKFKMSYTNKLTGFNKEIRFHIKLVVPPGQSLSFTQSKASY
jgi:hypothetical protein